MVTTNAARLRAAARDDQRKLAVRERQMLHAIRGVADEIEENNPGSIHSVEFTMSSSKLYAKITYNRNRDVDDDDGGSGADHAPKPTRSPRRRAKREADKAKPTIGQGDTPGPKVGTAGDEPAADAPMADADEAAAKATAAEMRKHVTDATTAVVLELGGDSSKASSEQYLCSDKTPLTIYGLKTKPIRLPKACPAAEMTPEYLRTCVEDLHKELHAPGATAADKERTLGKLRRALTPRRADKAPIAPAAPAAPAQPAFRFGAPPASAGFGGAAASSFGGSPPVFHNKPGTGG